MFLLVFFIQSFIVLQFFTLENKSLNGNVRFFPISFSLHFSLAEQITDFLDNYYLNTFFFFINGFFYPNNYSFVCIAQFQALHLNILVSISSTFLHTNFSYEPHFSSFYYLHATRKAAKTTFVRKIRT